MSASSALTTEGEAAWLRLKQHLEWCDHFSLVFVFSVHPLALSVLHSRLAELYRARVTRLEVHPVASPEELQTKVLPSLIHPPEHLLALQAPRWLDLSHELAPEWTAARLAFLTRLNEQREALRRGLTRPLVIVLPTPEHQKTRELAPDLWAIRDLTLFTGDWLVGPREATTDRPHADRGQTPLLEVPLSAAGEGALAEWKRVAASPIRERGVLMAGERAYTALKAAGRYDQAQAIAEWCLAAARALSVMAGETPEALRDLSVSLDNTGDIARALGQMEAARMAFDESLSIRRRSLLATGETPQALRDLSVSLNNTGDIARALGQMEAARLAFDESLSIHRRILLATGETPQALRDLSVSLDNTGDIARALGHMEAARLAFDESLSIRRRILLATGETPQALRDLSVSLDKTGDIARTLGQTEAARLAFDESLSIHRRILLATGETPEALRDLSVSLDKTGDIAQALGQTEAARLAFDESLSIRRRLGADR